MSKKPVVIEVTRGPVVESRHEGIAAVVKADGTVVASWGDIDAAILPRSATKPIQAIPFIESGAVESYNLGNEHIALSCASHNGEARHVDTVRGWLARLGLGENDLECGAHASRLTWRVEELARAKEPATNASNNCSGKHTGFLATAVQKGEHTLGYIAYDHPVQRRVRQALGDLAGLDGDALPYGIDGCGIPTLAMPLKSLARAMATMGTPSRLSSRRVDAIQRIRIAMNAEPFMLAGTDRFCTRLNGFGRAIQAKSGAEGVYCCILPAEGLGVAVKMWDGATRASEVAIAAILAHLGVLPKAESEPMVHPAIKNVVGLLVGEMRPARSWLG